VQRARADRILQSAMARMPGAAWRGIARHGAVRRATAQRNTADPWNADT